MGFVGDAWTEPAALLSEQAGLRYIIKSRLAPVWTLDLLWPWAILNFLPLAQAAKTYNWP